MHGIAQGLLKLLNARDADALAHAQQVGNLAQQLALALGLPGPEAQMIKLAGQLHDIGKLALPDLLLHKPGPLTEEEHLLIRQHPDIGAETVSCVPTLRPIAPLIRAHHEHWSGQGYPQGLVGDKIPLGARIIAIADSYAVMITGRTYQHPCSPRKALEELHRFAGSQFDPQIVETFIQMITADLPSLEDVA